MRRTPRICTLEREDRKVLRTGERDGGCGKVGFFFPRPERGIRTLGGMGFVLAGD